MKLSDVITPGDKIDIKMLHEANQEDNGGEIAKSIKVRSATFFGSGIGNFYADKWWKNGVISTGEGVQHCFYTKGGMYNCTAVVKKRYRKENLYLLRIVITSGLQKFQRREFSGFLIRHR